MKSAGSMTATLEDFQGVPGPVDRPLGDLLGSRRGIVVTAGLLSLALAIFAAASAGWLTAPAKPSALPLTGTWNCSLGGQPIGVLSVDGWNYALGASDADTPKDGTLRRVIYGKYREEFLKVQGGALKDHYGVNLGYHYHIAGKPEALVFSVGPESGIRCSRT